MPCGNDLILRAITHGAVAGGCRIWGRRDDRTASGLNRAAGYHSARAATLIAEWLDTGKTGDGCTYAAAPDPFGAGVPSPRRL